MSASPVTQRAQRVAKLTNKLDDDGRRCKSMLDLMNMKIHHPSLWSGAAIVVQRRRKSQQESQHVYLEKEPHLQLESTQSLFCQIGPVG